VRKGKAGAEKRPGYKTVFFRARVEVVEALDAIVDARNADQRARTLSEPKVTRTTLILEGLQQLLLGEAAAK
jgi:hypothetical protein